MERPKPRITLRNFLIATILVGTGVGFAFAGSRNMGPGHGLSDGIRFFSFFQMLASGPLIGAGLFLPFGKARTGAYLGFLIEVAILVVVIPHGR